MPLLSYFIKTVLCSGTLLAYYWLFLRNQRFHQYNRFYLLATLVLSLALPLFRLPIFFNTGEKAQSIAYRAIAAFTLPSANETNGATGQDATGPLPKETPASFDGMATPTLAGSTSTPSASQATRTLEQRAVGSSAGVSAPAAAGPTVDAATRSSKPEMTGYKPDASATPGAPLVTWPGLLLIIYLAGAAWLAAALVRALWHLTDMRHRYPMMRCGGLKLYQTDVKGTPFSFFQSIFWNTQIDINSAGGQRIFRHELYHVKQLHSADTLLAELAIIACWFNPFFWLLKKELTTIHEFLADRHATADGDSASYAALLVVQAATASNRSLPHYFSTSPIKRRITMILSSKPRKGGYVSRIMALPVLTVLAGTVVVNAQKAAEPIAQHKAVASTTIQPASASTPVAPADYALSQKPQLPGIKAATTTDTKLVATKGRGQEPTIEFVRQLQQSVVNMKQVEEKLGAPDQKILSSDESIWVYMSGGKMLRIQFNRKTDEIERFNYAQYGKPAKQGVRYEWVKEIQEDVTSKTSIEERFGKPTSIFLSNDEETWEYRLPNKELKLNFHVTGAQKELVSKYAYTENNPASH